MPKTKFQRIVFTCLMAFAMVYVMVCYNIALETGGMANWIFKKAFHEMVFMFPLAFVLEFFIVDQAAQAIAFRIITPQDRPFVIKIGISSVIVCLMCPAMSLAATLFIKRPGSQFVAIWLQTTVINFPMAFFSQTIVIGPAIRFIFCLIFQQDKVTVLQKQ